MTDDRPDYAGLPLPPAVLARLRSADSLRAELAGVTAERDALREQVDTTAWERDAAQGEAAYLRDDVLRTGQWSRQSGPPLGRLYAVGDDEPDCVSGASAAVCTLSSGRVFLRNPNALPGGHNWYPFGVRHVVYAWANLLEEGPLVALDGPPWERHSEATSRASRVSQHLYNEGPGRPVGGWPESSALARMEERERTWQGDDVDQLLDWLNDWHMLASATRTAWQDEKRRADKLTESLADAWDAGYSAGIEHVENIERHTGPDPLDPPRNPYEAEQTCPGGC